MADEVAVAIEIVRFVDGAQPGWVECRLVDAAGRAWSFVEKVPIVTAAPIDERSVYPQPGVIACAVLARRTDAVGRALVAIDTAHPWGVSSTDGETQFEVLASQLVRTFASS